MDDLLKLLKLLLLELMELLAELFWWLGRAIVRLLTQIVAFSLGILDEHARPLVLVILGGLALVASLTAAWRAWGWPVQLLGLAVAGVIAAAVGYLFWLGRYERPLNDQQEKSVTLRDLAAPNAQVAARALRSARSQGWLVDGSLVGLDLSYCALSHADLTVAHLQRARLVQAGLHEADLSAADLRAAELTEADLSDAWLDGADLGRAELAFARLDGASLRGANLAGTDLATAYLTGAHYDAHTVWPEGFDPLLAGAQLVTDDEPALAAPQHVDPEQAGMQASDRISSSVSPG